MAHDSTPGNRRVAFRAVYYRRLAALSAKCLVVLRSTLRAIVHEMTVQTNLSDVIPLGVASAVPSMNFLFRWIRGDGEIFECILDDVLRKLQVLVERSLTRLELIGKGFIEVE